MALFFQPKNCWSNRCSMARKSSRVAGCQFRGHRFWLVPAIYFGVSQGLFCTSQLSRKIKVQQSPEPPAVHPHNSLSLVLCGLDGKEGTEFKVIRPHKSSKGFTASWVFLFVMRPHIVTFGPGEVAWLLNKLRKLRFMLFTGAQQVFKCHFNELFSIPTDLL